MSNNTRATAEEMLASQQPVLRIGPLEVAIQLIAGLRAGKVDPPI